jgi:predicted dehydrogenase
MVRIAMLGAGFVAQFYMQGLRDVPDQKVVVVYSRTPERAEAFAQQWNIPLWTGDLKLALQPLDVDLAVIALPNFLHKEATFECVRARRPMVCTKPLGRTAAEAKEMLDAVRAAGIMHAYAETEVFSPSVMKAREMIERGSIGRVLTVRSREAHFGPHSAWFWDPQLAGGGALMDMGCHCIAAARHFVGKDVKPAEVLAWGDTLFHKTQAEDNAVLLIRFENGALAQAEVSWSARGGLDLRNEIYGSEGAIFTDVTRGTPMTAFTSKPAGYIVEKAEGDTGWVFPCVDEARVYGYHEEMRHFVECVKTGKTPRETYEDGFVVNLILDAGYRSMKTKRWEAVGA